MVPLSAIDKDKYPTLYKYWSAMRKDPTQANLPKWMAKNKPALDREISKWSKAWFAQRKASKG
jgi:hypothetical protein